jgi:CBS domain-containing protein
MKVEELMNKRVQSCLPTQTLADAAKVMWDADCGCVPVVDEEGRVAGMVTDRDICFSSYFQSKAPREIVIRDIMSQQVLSCRPGDRIRDAVMTMRNAQIRRLPVTDAAGHLVGILSLNDIALEAERNLQTHSSDVRLDDVGLTLSAVCHHRGPAIAAGPPA